MPFFNEVICRTDEEFAKLIAALVDDDGDVDFNRLEPVPELLDLPLHYPAGDPYSYIAHFIHQGGPATEDEVKDAALGLVPGVSFLEERPSDDELDGCLPFLAKPDIDRIVETSQDRDRVEHFVEGWNRAVEERGFPEGDHTACADCGERLLKALILHGFAGLDGWCGLHWGVPWNATFPRVGDASRSLGFDSPNRPALKIMRAVSERQGIDVFLRYSDGMPLKGAGEVVYEKGVEKARNEPEDDEGRLRVAKGLFGADREGFRFKDQDSEFHWTSGAVKRDEEKGIVRLKWHEMPLEKYDRIDASSEMLEAFLAGAE